MTIRVIMGYVTDATFFYENTTLFFGSSIFLPFAKYLRFTSEDEDGR